MTELWTTLLPLMLASAVLSVQIAVTILLLRSGAGPRSALAWVAGMTLVRLAQGVVFGLVLGTAAATSEGSGDPGLVESALLLLVAIVLYIAAVKQLLRQPDEDAPPPRWIAMADSMAPGKAFLFGVALVSISVKLWAFTLGAIGAIVDANLGLPAATAVYLLFVVVAASIHLAAIGVTFVMPTRSASILDRAGDVLQRYSRVMMITLSLVFGTWFALKALIGLGVP